MARTGRPVTNRYGVPKRTWNKWSPHAKRVFNSMFRALRPSNQFVFLHPEATPQKRQHWAVTRWNASWEAACAVDGGSHADAAAKEERGR